MAPSWTDSAEQKLPGCPGTPHTERELKNVLGAATAWLVALAGSIWASPASAYDDGLLCAFESPVPPMSSMAAPLAAVSATASAADDVDPAMCPPPPPVRVRALGASAGREALAKARRTADPAEALLALDHAREVFPAIADLIDLERGARLLALGRASEARDAFAHARDTTVESQVRVLARVGYTRSLLEMGHRDATESLRTLMRRYPELPEEPELDFAMARYQERRGRASEAVRRYRRLDVRHPASPAARRARERLEAMSAEGVAVPPMPPIQRVERAERLLRRGPLEDARTELAALVTEPSLGAGHRARVHFALAQIARHEGRWEVARQHYARGQATGVVVGDEDDQSRRLDRASSMQDAMLAREQEHTRRRIQQLRGRTPLPRHGTARVMAMARLAARADLPELTEYADELIRRDLYPGLRLRAALELVGAIDDERLLRLLDGLGSRPGASGMKAQYHRARALQRLGRFGEAEREFQAVIVRDRGITPFYGMWSELQLRAIAEQRASACGEGVSCAAAQSTRPAETEPRLEGTAPAGSIPSTDARPAPDFEALAADLAPVIERHGEAYPWLARARTLLLAHDEAAAGRQLYEAMLAYREAIGRAIRRSGLESVARGDNRARVFVPFPTRRARRSIDAADRKVLSDIGDAIGDFGAATGWGGWDAVTERPRAYAAQVEAAAERHGLDPNLLFAVMRVESIYQKDIVSYAGAIGLCQIMPRTGQLIANARGRHDYTSADLLDPETNLDFAAWYLRSLIERFDGHVPLAIASYNGGPHNVRRWLEDHPRDMPLDAFLEHIPFDQTHRYVRRVMTHYRAYRAQLGLPMIEVSTQLPAATPDTVAF